MSRVEILMVLFFVLGLGLGALVGWSVGVKNTSDRLLAAWEAGNRRIFAAWYSTLRPTSPKETP